MESGAAMLALSALGVIALAMALRALKMRLELSLAKHRSRTGHVRMARRIAGLIPFYAYDEAHFFSCDDAPDEIAARRRAGFMRLAALHPEGVAPAGRGPRQGARRERGAAPRRLHAARGALRGALRADRRAHRRGRGRHLRPAVHGRLPGALPVQPPR